MGFDKLWLPIASEGNVPIRRTPSEILWTYLVLLRDLLSLHVLGLYSSLNGSVATL